MSRTAWMAQRAALAFALMVGFYALGIAIAAALLWIPYAEAAYTSRIHPKIALACLVGAGTILWALVPRRDRFEAPGPRLDEANAPGLFALVREVAETTRQELPAEAYLLNEANAFVTQRGGVMGFGSRRVLGVGLPLLQALTLPELKAVIAHEFGHYAAGDVGLGPWVYKTRAAIGRTLEGLRDSWISAPFRLYGRLFLKLTQAVSREQEFLADELAARLAGRKAISSGLLLTASLPSAYTAYLEQEVTPVLRAGLLPPIASGFVDFVQSDAARASAYRETRSALEQDEAGEFDSHPPLKVRIDALERLNEADEHPGSMEAAAPLLREPDALARQLAEHVFGQEAISNLAPVDWPGVAEHVYLKSWRATVQAEAAWLDKFTADSIPAVPETLLAVVPVWRTDAGVEADEEARLRRGQAALACAIGVLLHEAGWRPDTAPGRPVTLWRDGLSYDPFQAVEALISGWMSADDWASSCKEIGVTGRRLVESSSAASAASEPARSTDGHSTPKAFPSLHRPKSDALYSIDQLGSHPERWATAPVQELADLLAFHSASLVHQRFADVYAVPLRQLHDLFERRATPEERLRCLQAVADAVDRLSRGSDLRDAGAALSRFLYDPDLLIATTAALNLAAVYAPQADEPMSGVASIASMASQGLNHKRRAAWLAGLVALGDERVLSVVDGCWKLVSPAGWNVLARNGIGTQPSPAMVEFFLRWAETAVGDTQGERSLGSAFAGLINLANRAGSADADGNEVGLIEIDRALPAWTSPVDSVIKIRKRWTKEAVGRVIESRLRAVAEREQEPRVAGQVLTAWGLDAMS